MQQSGPGQPQQPAKSLLTAAEPRPPDTQPEVPDPSVPPDMEPVVPQQNPPQPGRPGDGQPPPVIA